MKRVVNFAPGPAALPLVALEEAQRELLDYQGLGMSIMEMSHRGKDYDAVHNEALSLLRELLGISSDYEVLFLQGGASQQFAVVPMNLLPGGKSADYIVTGTWGEKAVAEANFLGKTRVAATTLQGKKYVRVAAQRELDLDPNAAYVHMTSNNTIFGTQFHTFPETGNVPLIVDMSSDIAWRPIDVSKFGLIYAGAQKNLGPTGITVVIVRKDLVAQGRADIPRIFQYRTHAKENSLYNTIPTFSVYLMRNVLRWLKNRGGLTAVERDNREKAKRLYGVIDANPKLFITDIEKESRSVMNVVFTLPTESIEQKFIAEAKARDLVNLKGHRILGGIRVSLYNAISVEDTQKLVDFMQTFARENA
ncbi:MAG: 3-phosphoserine/phosphohydroxythreonine transaminase [Sandaracinaceae bacterium]|nr:3-phosphoserine/phosphohydroxythreonine transaminase [Sandaracinaceae bacterium]